MKENPTMKTRLIRWSVGLALLVLSGALGCFRHDANKDDSSQPQAAVAAGEAGSFDERLLEIASSYKNYRCFNEVPQFAPAFCRAAPSADPTPRISASQDSTTHGRKLYWLFVK